MVSPRKLLAGVARIDITPPIGIELFGYHRPSPMTDIHDPLWLTVLALVDEYDSSQPYLLLAIDNIGLGQEATHHITKWSLPPLFVLQLSYGMSNSSITSKR